MFVRKDFGIPATRHILCLHFNRTGRKKAFVFRGLWQRHFGQCVSRGLDCTAKDRAGAGLPDLSHGAGHFRDQHGSFPNSGTLNIDSKIEGLLLQGHLKRDTQLIETQRKPVTRCELAIGRPTS